MVDEFGALDRLRGMRGRGMIRMSRRRLAGSMVALAVLPLTASAPVWAGDVAAGRRKAIACQTCHGLDGLSKLPEAPHLAGQPERYLVKSLDEYRRGTRRHEMMTLVVKDLTDRDIADLAAYYGAIEISATPPK
jgi:cytochrome c553